ncbi:MULTISPECIES: enoyl-CoA hydratase/isomerase family protein [Halomonadaceae]|uniref:Enoyl-CoA hydratase/isomerase family protein n=2 Tax=Vreelandella TaxID=3137766 RepID=A0A7Z0LVY3_9GAMM|nr:MULTISPECIES: enoyl-CoA hydratase/isomerase family protein [Halomonas]NYS79598.1 enoyl-CoA hydratase/isomerase family protein [Halomonas glaciei]|tara:strand:+ start:6842 stop:7648 length:807 start_codon:yes stop_codon:yes gene_type:complete
MSNLDESQAAQSVTFSVRNGVAWIGFNRPQSRNAMTWEMYDALEKHCDQLAEDDTVYAVVLHGVGGEAFVAGTDISQFSGFTQPEDAIAYERRIDRVVGKLETFPKPTLALIEGACVGGGAALALVCDFRYATPTMKFGVPIAKTLGNTLSINNVSRMIDMLGVARTKEALMMARLFGAEESQAAGLINQLFDADAIYAEVTALAEAFAKRSPLTLQASKALIGRALEQRRLPADASDDWVTICYMSRDFAAAVDKFVNKTPFEWSGH